MYLRGSADMGFYSLGSNVCFSKKTSLWNNIFNYQNQTISTREIDELHYEPNCRSFRKIMTT